MPDAPLTGTRKANFSDIYLQPDPRQYYRVLSRLDYQIPRRALPVFREVLAASRQDGRNRTVLDICCSYGINSAQLFSAPGFYGHGETAWPAGPAAAEPAAAEPADREAAWYASQDRAGLSPADLAAADRRRHAGRAVALPTGGLTVRGLDVSAPAIDYACRAGLLTRGWAEDLEAHDPSPDLAAGIADTGLIISTGGFGYVTGRTFERVLRAVREPENLWLAVFVLRVFDYAPVADLLSSYGLVTESLGTTFRQRRFADDAERQAALYDVRSRGLDPAGKEATGWYHTECFLTRPAADAARLPAPALLAPALRQQAA